jgi:N-acetylmuramoyl-L-alanine amidase
MIPYLLKLSLSLALLLGCYYLLFRKDKWFLFNRFYLLSSLLFSLAIPFISLPPVFDTAYFDDSHLSFSTQLLEISSNTKSDATALISQTRIKPAHLLYFIYGAVVLAMAFRYAKHLWAMHQLLANCESCSNSPVPLRLTEEPVAPFSFSRYVVVNKQKYLTGKVHEEIIRHETLHIRHWHTLDILLIEFILIFFWFHPLVWMYRQALTANHEFCADDFAIRGNADISSYSHVLLDFMQHRSHPYLGSGFQYSLTKHRILMMQRSASTTFAFANKVLLTLMLVGCILSVTSFTNLSSSPPLLDDSFFTVVLDAGHGGSDAGVTNTEKGYQEKALVLAIVQAVDDQMDDPTIRLVFTREKDRGLTLKERIEIAAQSQANLFLSLHINQHDDQNQRGVEVYYSEKNSQSSLSREYGQQLAQNVSLTGNGNVSVKTADFLVLREASCPSLLLNLGFLSNSQDAAFLVSEDNQRQLASQIVRAITEIQKE